MESVWVDLRSNGSLFHFFRVLYERIVQDLIKHRDKEFTQQFSISSAVEKKEKSYEMSFEGGLLC
jgi:hypothetical protein